ncbi:hypothetical protein CRM22_002817, partial [Opisthorchis felineus]
VLSLPEFLQTYHPNLSEAKLLLDSLQASLHSKKTAVQHAILSADGQEESDGQVVKSTIVPNDAAEVVSTAVGAVEHATEADRVDFTPAAALWPSGFVVGVLSRNWRDYVCTYVPESGAPVEQTGWVLVTPWDRRIPRIRLHTTQAAKLAKER